MVGSHQDIYELIIQAGHLKRDAIYAFERFGGQKTVCRSKDLFENITALEKAAFKNIKKGDRVLDIGAGGGRISMYLQGKGYNITALDKSKSICEILDKKGIKRVVSADVLNYYPKNKFTAVLFVKTYSVFGKSRENIAKAFRHFRERVIGRRGRLFVILDDTESGRSENAKRRFVCAGEIGPWFVSLHPSFKDVLKSARDAGFKTEKIKRNKRGEYFLILKIYDNF